jgi:hypothetical protein
VPSVSVKSAQRLWLSVERAIGIRTYFRFHCFSPKKVSPRRVAVLLSRQYTALTHWGHEKQNPPCRLDHRLDIHSILRKASVING